MTLQSVFVSVVGVMACLLSADAPYANGQSITPSDSAKLAQPLVQPSTRSGQPDRYRLTGRFHLQKATNSGYLVLQCDLPKGSYVYSLTQQGTVRPTVIKVKSSDAFATTGKFIPDQQPTVIEKDKVFQQRVEKHLGDHNGKVQFFIPIQIHSNVDPATLQPEMVFDGQVCSSAGVCMPIRNKSIKAKFAGYFERTAEKPVSPENPKRQ